LLQEEVLQLLTAARDGDVATVQQLITKLDVNVRGPYEDPWVSWVFW